MDKYDKDAEFADPVVRCDSCNKIIQTVTLRTIGRCAHCGNRKIRNLQIFSKEERIQMERWGVDPEFLALFEERNDA